MRLASRLDECTPALSYGEQSFVDKHANSAACGVPCYAVLLHEVADARHPGTRRKVARADAVPQDRGHLEIRWLCRVMINFHVTRLNVPDLAH